MSTIVTRAGKGSPLTHVEVDANFTNLNTDKVEKTAAAITGGTINGTTIGATTPSTVNATTITGQTGVLRGTGQNLIINSQTINTSPADWTTIGSATLTGNSTTAPDSTTTASTLTASGTQSSARRGISPATISGIVYTGSMYFKAGTGSFGWIGLVFVGVTTRAWFNLGTGTVGTLSAGVTATITSVGNGWYRCTATGTSTAAFGFIDFGISNADNTTNVTAGQTIFLWGAQLEVGSIANTYLVTTSAVIYGTPTLSFSGVSTIGLESNGSLFVQPAGTGALQAQATTSTTAGGNARGIYATDWQTKRNTASQVASGFGCVVSGGEANIASGFAASVVGGGVNNSSGTYSFIGGGYQNSGGSSGGSVVNGYTNTAAGYWNFIGNGFTNSGTSASAATTQATTTVTSGSTAVTLSGSNANIRVGQLITGTGINTFPHTYVSAISGTSLTLSQNATATGTPTLSFFTPHGVVVGGGNNQATGSYSFIGGGGDAGTAANRNVASGDWSVVAGGWKNTASSNYSFVGGGGANTASTGFGAVVCGGGFFGNLPTQSAGNTSSGTSSFVGAGFGNQASGFASFVGTGNSNLSNSNYSGITSGAYGSTRSIVGNQVFPACNTPIASASGVSQSALLILAVQTTDATATALRSDTSAAGTTNQVILPNNSAYFFRGEVISGVTGGGDTKGFTIEGVIKRGANAASTALVGTPTVTSSFADAGASTWTIAVTADTTNGGLRVTFTGQASTTIRTVCQIRTTETTF